MSNVIAIIDDDCLIGDYFSALLEPYGYRCQYFESAEAFLFANKAQSNHACLLVDWNLPGISGLDLIKLIKSWTTAPPIMLITGNHNDNDLAYALHSGADDFITKPLNRTLFLARFRALSRRARYAQKNWLNSVGFTLIAQTLELEVMTGERVSLSRKEFLLLEFLASHPGEIIDRHMLANITEDSTNEKVAARQINLIICRLRKKLANLMSIKITIRSIYGKGYMIVIDE